MEHSDLSVSSKVGLVYNPIFLEHDTGDHVENSQRLVSIMSLLDRSGITQKATAIPTRPATMEELLSVHSDRHIATVERTSQKGGGWLDGDTVMAPPSYEAALHAAGGLIEAVDTVLQGNTGSAFALVRPPGHHATQNRAMGFCLFNNIAVAARSALKRVDRVLIVDFDVHHGNGTQDMFYEDPCVLYFSTHQYPHYPGSGDVDETGSGSGKGTTVNVPFPALCGDEEYLRALNEVLVPAARRFRPQLIMVSAGYDAHWADPLASMQVTTTGYAQMTAILKDLASELCQGRIVFTLEGGYDLSALSQSVKSTIETLMGEAEIHDVLGRPQYAGRTPNIEVLFQQLRKVHKLY